MHFLARTLFRLLLLALAVPTLTLAQNRVLFIGNSFTIGAGGGGVPGIFDRLAQAGGHANPDTVMAAVGGTDFQYHSGSPDTQSAIASRPWTHVILQNYSTEPTHLASGSVADHYSYGTLLHQQVLQNHPHTKVILFETWSRSAAHSLITGVSSPSGFASTTEFQSELRTNYRGLADSLNAANQTNPVVRVAPVGTAWENAGALRDASDPLFLRLFGSDEYHGNNNGYYLAACVFYSLIYDVSPHGLSTNSLITSLNLGLTVSPTLLEDFAWATVSNSQQIGVQSFLFDFGPASAITTNGAAPADPANHWNNVTENIGTSTNGQLTNLITTGGAPTDINLLMLNRFNDVNENGATASSAFPVSATRDSLYGNTELFNTRSNIFPSFKLTDLNPARTYSFTFYASRTAASDNRETIYTITGETSAQAVLNAANNVDATVIVSGIVPDTNGEITISLAPGANNNNNNHFTYLNVMRVDAAPEQHPIVFTQQPASQEVVVGFPVSFTATVQGTPPYFIQWLSNGIAIPGATQFTYNISSTTTNLHGTAYSVTVSNLAYSATSTNAVLQVIAAPTNGPGQTLLFDFGGANTTSAGATPNDPFNFWNNVTSVVGTSSTGTLTNLVTTTNGATTLGLVMLSRFNGVNENGALDHPWFPPNATRDSMFGNTEAFSAGANMFPKFKFVGLNPAALYHFTFYASRMGVSDNRETGYTVEGANTGFAALNAGNNVTGSVTVSNISPSAAREITISLAPTANNNNANHFTYLNVLRVVGVVTPPEFQTARIANGQVRLEWTGTGQLEWSPSLEGPWQAVTPQPVSPYLQNIVPGETRFFRIVSSP